jgi:hypothetical protein
VATSPPLKDREPPSDTPEPAKTEIVPAEPISLAPLAKYNDPDAVEADEPVDTDTEPLASGGLNILVFPPKPLEMEISPPFLLSF